MRVVRKAVEAALLVAALGLAGLMIGPALLGFERYVITTGSMTGAHDAGSLVIGDPVPVADLRVGDVITYTPPPDAAVPGRVTHRIDSIGEDAGGQRVIRTKGDANDRPDAWEFVARSGELPRVVAGVPHVGRAYAALTTPLGSLLVFVIPALLIALAVVAQLWREAGEESRRAAASEVPA